MNKELRVLSVLNCRPGAPILPVSELMLRLHALPGWDYADNRISKTFRFANYYETIGFVNVIASPGPSSGSVGPLQSHRRVVCDA